MSRLEPSKGGAVWEAADIVPAMDFCAKLYLVTCVAVTVGTSGYLFYQVCHLRGKVASIYSLAKVRYRMCVDRICSSTLERQQD